MIQVCSKLGDEDMDNDGSVRVIGLGYGIWAKKGRDFMSSKKCFKNVLTRSANGSRVENVPSANKTKKKKAPKLNGKGRMMITVWVTPELNRALKLAAKLERLSKSDLIAQGLGRIASVKGWL